MRALPRFQYQLCLQLSYHELIFLKTLSFFSRNGRMQYFSILFHRIWRLWPTLAFVAFFQMTLFKFAVDTPHYNEIDSYRHGCEEHIWKTLFFTSNYLGREVRRDLDY